MIQSWLIYLGLWLLAFSSPKEEAKVLFPESQHPEYQIESQSFPASFLSRQQGKSNFTRPTNFKKPVEKPQTFFLQSGTNQFIKLVISLKTFTSHNNQFIQQAGFIQLKRFALCCCWRL